MTLRQVYNKRISVYTYQTWVISDKVITKTIFLITYFFPLGTYSDCKILNITVNISVVKIN